MGLSAELTCIGVFRNVLNETVILLFKSNNSNNPVGNLIYSINI